MPRAKRHFLPARGYIWHITHRCHKREFLLKFKKDKLTWQSWIFRAKRAYGLKVLDYVVTSNHIHLLVFDKGDPRTIPRSLHLAAGQTAQRYNRRKKRVGAFWQDRYHATAVEAGPHLVRCIKYIDLNMVRAGVVSHPDEWPFGGFNEIQGSKAKYCLIDWRGLLSLFSVRNRDELRAAFRSWVEADLREKRLSREGCWTESIAVGSKEFATTIKNELRERGIGKKILEDTQGSLLQEIPPTYRRFFRQKVGSRTEKP
ncbi:MAG: transposase [Acidobacteriota bacterium]